MIRVCFGSYYLRDSLIMRNLILMSSLLFYRGVIHACTMRNHKGSPLLTLLMTGFFATMNGFLQAYTLIHLSVYPSNWLYSPRFLIGALIHVYHMVYECSYRNIRIA